MKRWGLYAMLGRLEIAHGHAEGRSRGEPDDFRCMRGDLLRPKRCIDRRLSESRQVLARFHRTTKCYAKPNYVTEAIMAQAKRMGVRGSTHAELAQRKR
jgi:hypothetical protein